MRKSFLMLFTLAVCVVTASGVYAFGGFQGNEAAKNALENEDYDAFIQALPETGKCGNIAERMTEENFHQLTEQYRARASVEQALEDGDYDAWVEAIESRPKITDLITEENFDSFVELHNARKSGDHETANALAEELGLNQMPMRGFGRGFHSMNKWKPPF
ncbi:MAG: hypothetical protein ABIE23_03180 [archaeon]|nr:hypothetical protein [Candidatus Micrarchaeota archaeon]